MFNDLGDDPELLAAFEVLMTVPKAPPGTKMFADRAAAMALLLEASDRACASSKSEAAVPGRPPLSEPSKEPRLI